jgi:hypothetical protein
MRRSPRCQENHAAKSPLPSLHPFSSGTNGRSLPRNIRLFSGSAGDAAPNRRIPGVIPVEWGFAETTLAKAVPVRASRRMVQKYRNTIQNPYTGTSAASVSGSLQTALSKVTRRSSHHCCSAVPRHVTSERVFRPQRAAAQIPQTMGGC